MKTKLLGILVILFFGAARMNFEQQVTNEHRAAYFNTARLDLDLRQQLGQMGFLAALSGFRSALADILWIQADSAWRRVEWGRMKLLMDTVTALQPRAMLFWDNAAWHMAWNASVAAFDDRRQPREALRVKAQFEYFKVGEDYLLRGIQNNPDRCLLYHKLGALYSIKFKDHAKAADYYEKALRFPNAPEYLKRFVAYEMAEVPGREQDAYQRLLGFYNQGPSERLPSVIRILRELEQRLNVPSGQRIAIPEPHP